MRRDSRLLVGLTIALVFISAPHAAEDFQYGEFGRAGIKTIVAGAILGALYALQAYGCVLAGRGDPTAAVVLGLAGAIWCVGAVLIHGSEVLAPGPYREGWISKTLVVAIVLLGASLAGLAVLQRGTKQ